METLNAIEKFTLLLSTSIVFLANLFVLLEKSKRNKRNYFNIVIEKFVRTKSTFLAFILTISMCSCTGNKFLNRKYTSGIYTRHIKASRMNTVYLDTVQHYASGNSQLEFKKSPVALNEVSENIIIDTKVSSIIKKDSIFIISKRGRNKKVVVKNDLPNVFISVDENNKRHIKKTLTKIQTLDLRKALILKMKVFSIVAICFSLIPFLGLLFSILAKTLIKQTKEISPCKSVTKYKTLANIALALSILSSIAGIIIIVAIIIALSTLFSAMGTFTIM